MIKITSEVTETIEVPMWRLRRLLGTHRYGQVKILTRVYNKETQKHEDVAHLIWRWSDERRGPVALFTNTYTNERKKR